MRSMLNEGPDGICGSAMRISWLKGWTGERRNRKLYRSGRSAAAIAGSRGQQGIELAGAVERDEIVITADVDLADVYLRHGAPPGLAHHLQAQRRLEIDAHL